MKRFISIFLILSLISYAQAAIIRFNNGSTISGELKEITQDKIFFENNSLMEERDRNEIISMTSLTENEKELVNAFYSPDETDPQKTTEVNSVKNEMENAAFDTLLLFRSKLQAKFEEEKSVIKAKFLQEKNFLEKNIEILAQKLAQSHDKSNNSISENKALHLKQQEDKALIARYEQNIINLKNELSYITEARLKSEVATVEKIQKAIVKNKKLIEKEKQSLINSYESQINDFEKQLSDSNIQILQLAKTNSNISAKLANAEKLSDQNGSALIAMEKQFKSYKKEIENKKLISKEKTKQSQLALEKMLSNSADKLNDLTNEIKMLNEEITFLKDENKSKKMALQIKKDEITTLEADNKRYKEEMLKSMKKQQELKLSIKEKQKNMLKSLIDAAVIETGVDGIPQNITKDAKTALYNAKLKGKIDALKNRNALFDLFQNDIGKLTSELDQTKKELNAMQNHNVSLKTNLQKSEYQLDQLVHENKQAKELANQFKEEKNIIKSDVQQIIEDIRKEARENLEKQKEELQNSFQKTVDTINQQNKQQVDLGSYEDLDISNDIYEDPNKTDESPYIPELIPAEKQIELNEKVEDIKAPETTDRVSIEVGVISQIEPEFSRVFIDTKEILKEGDILYTPTKNGDISLTILKIYPALNGAIAEISDPGLIDNIKIKNKVYYS